jgi:hypothetical protein
MGWDCVRWVLRPISIESVRLSCRSRWPRGLRHELSSTVVAQWLRLALSKGPNWVGVFSLHFTGERKQFQFLKRRVFSPKNTGRWKKSKDSLILCGIHHRQNPIKIYLWTVFSSSNAGIMSSSPTRVMDVYVRLFCVCVILCGGRGSVTGWSPVQGVLRTVYRVKKLENRLTPNKVL